LASALPAAQAAQELPLTPQLALWEYRPMLGEFEDQFCLTRAALSGCGAQKQFLLVITGEPVFSTGGTNAIDQ
jgi:hypothetical protein